MENNFRIILAKQKKKILDVHNATGISKTTLSDIYHERARHPAITTFIKIAKYLNVTLDELVSTNE